MSLLFVVMTVVAGVGVWFALTDVRRTSREVRELRLGGA